MWLRYRLKTQATEDWRQHAMLFLSRSLRCWLTHNEPLKFRHHSAYGSVCHSSLRNMFLSASHNIDTVCIRAQLHLTLLIPWTIAHRAPLSMEFPRQEYWSWLPFPTPGDLPDTGIEPKSLVSPALAGRFFTTAPLLAQSSLSTFNFFFCPSLLHQFLNLK